ncbi:MAG TPA: response regulator [Flavitalea sp.]|nr:response regulator [Flavitalea sp.]
MSTSNTRGAHILFSDDDTDDALLFTQAADLLSSPVLLSFAEDGEQLMRYLSKELLPDMIFLDLNMPVKNGFECVELIRADKRFDALPIIIYTTSDNPNDINTCHALGANLYIVKPNSFDSIIKTLKRALAINWKTQPFPTPREHFVLPTY